MKKVGDLIKVFLKGESPWAEVVHVFSRTRVRARIDNETICPDIHGLNYNDIAEFELVKEGEFPPCWYPILEPLKIIK